MFMIATKVDFNSSAVDDIMGVVQKSFAINELKGSITKFDHLFQEITLGLVKNETITREGLFIWVEKTNKKGLRALKSTGTDATNEMMPEKKLTPDERRSRNLKKTFSI